MAASFDSPRLNRPGAPPAASFDRQLAQQYGLDDVTVLSHVPAASAGVTVARIAHAQPHLFVLDALPSEDAFVLHADMAPGGVRRFAGLAESAPTRAGSVHIQDLREARTAYWGSPFDALVFHYPRAALESCAADLGRPAIEALRCPRGDVDPVVAGISRALLGAAAQLQTHEPLFIDHLSLALGLHLIGRYGDGVKHQPLPTGGRLSAMQLQRTQTFLRDNLGRSVTLAEVAAECGLSRSYFVRAFKQTVGQTPHDWLTDQRVASASDLLGHPARSIAEVALACGFADQSHFTRVFARRRGVTPAAWRRAL